MKPISILNYQGNKSSLMPFINNNLEKYISPGDTICDIFAGSGSVSAYLNQNYTIIANDLELYSAIICSALLNTPSKTTLLKFRDEVNSIYFLNLNQKILENKTIIEKEDIFVKNQDNKSLIDLYNSIPTVWNNLGNNIHPSTLRNENKYNLFLRYYSGTYFGIAQSIEIDSIIQTIKMLDSSPKDVLFSCLFYAMKETVFSKDGHMAQPLNITKNPNRHITQRKKSIYSYFNSKLIEFIDKSEDYSSNLNKIYNYDISTLLNRNDFLSSNIKLIYADPPYTDMQYSRYYHLLNVAARYDYPELTISQGSYTKGLYTEGRNQSDLSKKSTAKLRIFELFEVCKKNKIILALSYAYPRDSKSQNIDRYTVSIEELVEMAKNTFGSKCVQIEKIEYKHSNQRNSTSKEVLEYLIICGKEIHASKFNLIDLKYNLQSIIPTSKNPIYNTHLYWSQKSFNIIDELIRCFSQEGDIVFDPFMGSGVTIFEAIKKSSNRIAIGCDVNDMPLFIVNTVLNNISKSDLVKIFDEFEIFLNSLKKYYTTTCPSCGKTAKISKVIFDKPNRTINDFSIKTLSIQCNSCGRISKNPDSLDYQKFSTTSKNIIIDNCKLIQNSKIAVGSNDKISDIFTPRNFSVLNEIIKYINTSNDKQLLQYLLMSIIHLSKITDTHSNSQWPLWIPKVNCVEKNILDLLNKKMDYILKAKKYVVNNYINNPLVNEYSMLAQNKAMILIKGSQFITNEEIPDNSVSLIITDPPYMDQVLYSEYMQLYKPFIGVNFNLEDEIIVSSSSQRKRNKREYFSLLNDVFAMCSKKLKVNHFMCLFFHDSNLEDWCELIIILERNGFRFVSQEHIKKSKTVKNILSPKKSLSGDAVLFFENTGSSLPISFTSLSTEEIKHSIYLEAKKLLEKKGDLSTPELYDLGLMEMLIQNGWLKKISTKYKSLVDIFEEYFIWKSETAKWHLPSIT